MLFDAQNHALRVLSGVPQRSIYDNLKTATDRIYDQISLIITNLTFSGWDNILGDLKMAIAQLNRLTQALGKNYRSEERETCN